MIKNIIFDMGGVLINFDRDLFIRRLGVSDEDSALLKKHVFLSIEWAMLDRGTLSDTQAAGIMSRKVPERLQEKVKELVLKWDEPLIEIEGMYDLIKELYGSGYNIYLLSNASFRQHEYWPRISSSRFFKDTLISSDVKLVKPQTEIYNLACRKFGIEASECVFIDDSIANAEGAVFAGMKGIVFHDPADLRAELIKLGVSISA